jgi:uracil-DNA glycosylase family 4
MKCLPVGPLNAKIMVVGEAPGAEEERVGQPFVGMSGSELTRMLHDAGIPRTSVFLTNIARVRPPGNDISKFFLDKKLTKPGPEITEGLHELFKEISTVNPSVIVALGNIPLWALTGHRGITSWRGSILKSSPDFGPRKVLPTYHPAAILRQWDWRFIAVHDLRRAFTESATPEINTPAYDFTIRPSYEAVISRLSHLIACASNAPLRLALDLETRGGHIACLGIAWSRLDALCIPFMCVENPLGYWSVEQEFEIVKLLRKLTRMPGVEIVGQNFLYDAQYFARYWGFAPEVHMDTMLAHHLCWPGMPKGLDFLSSMYCTFHQYWKQEGKLWDPRTTPEEQLWVYNCKDAVITWECSHALDGVITQLDLRAQFVFQMQVFHTIFRVMLRGVAVDHALRQTLTLSLLEMVAQREHKAQYLSGRGMNFRSPKQLGEYFYDTLHLPEQRNRKTGKRTCDEDALKVLAQREPLARRLIHCIIEARSLGAASNVVQTPLDQDRRLRCSYNVAGTVTFRFSSSENAFGSGTNLQNITKGKRSEETGLELPNLRRLIVPDGGKLVVDVDLDRADLQVVVWEADDADLKAKLREGVDIHVENAKDIFRLREVNNLQRQVAKVFVHATDYGGKARTVAIHCGLSVHETELYQRRWFDAHPGIKAWHARVERDLMTRREVRNAFGYRIFFFDRIEHILPEALAWIPQSTVALVINRAMVNLDRHCPDVDILLQVHDSLTLQIPQRRHPAILNEILPHLLIVVPYPDPLTIPVGFAVSEKSWGDVEEFKLEVDSTITPRLNGTTAALSRLA